MGLYNAMFGNDPLAGALLAILGLEPSDMGRFRDASIADGKIAVYTRNGAGNRYCWCADDPKYGTERCRHRVVVEQVQERVEMPEADAVAKGYTDLGANIIRGDGSVWREPWTGRMVDRDYYVCENPDSPDCRCVGCFMTYHVKGLPHYSHDRDDDWDGTYATIWFDFPPEWANLLAALEKPAESPGDRWTRVVEEMRAAPDMEALDAVLARARERT